MPHFFINSNKINNNVIIIDDEELLKHLVKSLRINNGEHLKLFDENKIIYETVVKDVSDVNFKKYLTLLEITYI